MFGRKWKYQFCARAKIIIQPQWKIAYHLLFFLSYFLYPSWRQKSAAFCDRTPIRHEKIKGVSWDGFSLLKFFKNSFWENSLESFSGSSFTKIFYEDEIKVLNAKLYHLRGILIDVGITPVSFSSCGSRTSISNFSLWFGRSFTSS